MWRTTRSSTIAAVMLAGMAAGAADLPVGTILGPNDIPAAKPLLTPGSEWALANGIKIEVGKYVPIQPPREYLDATEKYSSQVRLSPDGRLVENYVAGLPFPRIDPNDPQCAAKTMWNFEYSWFYTDDLSDENFAATTGPVSNRGEVSLERLLVMSHYKRLKYTGRIFVDPKPTWQTADNRRYAEILSPFIEPYDLKGVGSLYYRYNEPERPDETFLYLPTLRRTRRLSATERSLGQFGTDFDLDSYGAYAGKISWSDWRYLGEHEVLAPMHIRDYPPSMSLERLAPDDVWEKRKVHVVEGRSRLPQYAYSKRVLYVDVETWRAALEDMYDPRGELYKILFDFFSYRRKAFDSPKVRTYDYDAGFLPYEVIVDVQSRHASTNPSPFASRYHDEEGFYFNAGDKMGVRDDVFTVANLIAQGR